jgi:hypothetical protein
MMNIGRAKMFSAAMGGCALFAALLLNVTHPDQTWRWVAGGSGDSATTTVYTQPTIPGMSFNPTAMSTGATVKAASPATTLVSSVASPTYKATAAAGCVNNGQCP